MRLIVLPLILLSFHYCVAQHSFSVTQIPVFNSQEDSLKYAMAQAQFNSIGSNSTKALEADSLMRLILKIRENNTKGMRAIYHPTKSFITLDSLKSIKDVLAVKNLVITNLKSHKLPKQVIQCKNIQHLELVNTKIQSLKNFKKLPYLESVYVLNNKPLHKLRLGVSRSIRTFGIRGENPELVPTNYKKIRALQKLDMASSGLSTFPVGIHSNKHLKELLLNNNNIDLSDTKFKSNASIEQIELQRNKIKGIPSTIKNITNLKKLSFNHNQIEEVSPAIGNLKKLEELSFYRNRLKAIPEGLYSLPNLKVVDLYYNEIERIDDRIVNIASLEVLFLSNNKIISIPESIGNLQKLEELYLSNNRLSDLPSSVTSLYKLKVLRINGNYLTAIPKDLRKLTLLENLDISSNQIEHLTSDIASLTNLKLLVMMNNPWDNEALAILPTLTDQLRIKEVVVHIDEN